MKQLKNDRLVTIEEAGTILDIRSNTLRAWERRWRGRTFPEPVVVGRTRRLWDIDDIRRWHETYRAES